MDPTFSAEGAQSPITGLPEFLLLVSFFGPNIKKENLPFW